MDQSQRSLLLKLLDSYEDYVMDVFDDNIQLTRRDGRIVIVIAIDKDYGIILKGLTIILSNNDVRLEYNYDPYNGHSTWLIVNEMPVWGHLEHDSPIQLSVPTIDLLVHELNRGGIPSPIAGRLFPTLMFSR